MRPSKNPNGSGGLVPTEDLLVSNEQGQICYYVVEWPHTWEVGRDSWGGTATLVATIAVHTQQICGLVWAPSGREFVSGSNDNMACYFEIEKMLKTRKRSSSTSSNETVRRGRRSEVRSRSPEIAGNSSESRFSWLPKSLESFLYGTPASEAMAGPDVRGNGGHLVQGQADEQATFIRGSEKHCWRHGAAVKAIAFCPWQETLIATGGGSSDKCIHFWHTGTGTALATIAVSAQVTSLIWSTTRPEIVATFGYATPDHPYRIAVFSWPSCEQIGAVALDNGARVLYAIPYPGAPADAKKGSRSVKEGSIVMATSDENVKFHDVWQDRKNAPMGGVGVLSGSDILEGLDGIFKEGAVIR